MLLNEPTAALRVVHMYLLDTTGAGLPLATVFSAGQCKISKAGGAFANTVNLPQPIATGVAGTFTLQLELAEVNTVGQLRIQVSPTGGRVWDAVDEVRETSVDSSSIAAAVGNLVIDSNAPAGAQKLKEALNIIAAYVAGPGIGFPTSVLQSITHEALGGNKTRLKTSISGGERVIDEVDGT